MTATIRQQVARKPKTDTQKLLDAFAVVVAAARFDETTTLREFKTLLRLQKRALAARLAEIEGK